MSDRTPTVARLVACTEDARHALGAAEVIVERFPFKVGRECRTAATKVLMAVERRLRAAPQLNNIYLVEPVMPHHMSSEHFLIDVTQQGTFVLTDRGSVCGTTVNGETIGGDRRGGHVELHGKDEIVVGTADSPFVFEFRVE